MQTGDFEAMKLIVRGTLRKAGILGFSIVFLALTLMEFLWDTSYKPSHKGFEFVDLIPENKIKSESGFVPYTGEDLVTLHDLCIEESPNKEPFVLNYTVMGPAGKHEFDFTRKILVAYGQDTDGTLVVPVEYSYSYSETEWIIQLRTEPRPTKFKYITSHPAYFLLDGLLCNLWNFRRDTFSPLYQNLRRTHNLQPKVKSKLYFYNPVHDITKLQQEVGVPSTKDPNCFRSLLTPLGVRDNFDSFHKVKDICYKNAVFGQDYHQIRRHGYDPAPAYIKKLLGIADKPCPTQPVVTLIGRKTRRITNLNELWNVSVNAGFTNTKIVYFEEFSVEDQMHIAHCTDVLVGVQGAALGWAPFMQPSTSLIEIAWPEKNWAFVYKFRFKNYNDMHTFGIEPRNITPNFEAFEKSFLMGRSMPLTEEFKAELIHRTNGSIHFWNIWKYADVQVDSQEFLFVLKMATQRIRHLKSMLYANNSLLT